MDLPCAMPRRRAKTTKKKQTNKETTNQNRKLKPKPQKIKAKPKKKQKNKKHQKNRPKTEKNTKKCPKKPLHQPQELRSNRDVVLAAVQRDGGEALQYAAEEKWSRGGGVGRRCRFAPVWALAIKSHVFPQQLEAWGLQP